MGKTKHNFKSQILTITSYISVKKKKKNNIPFSSHTEHILNYPYENYPYKNQINYVFLAFYHMWDIITQ